MDSVQGLRARIRAELPPRAHETNPWSGLIAIPCLGVIVGGMWAISAVDLPWYAALGCGLLVGHAWGIFTFLAHDTLHGSVFRSRWLQDLIGYAGFSIFFVTPTLWRVWHNYVHHGHSNVPDVDSDSYGTTTRFARVPLARFQFKTSPGSGSWISAFYLFYRFTYHALIVLFIISKHYPKEFQALRRRRAIVEMLLLVAGWTALAVALGPWAALFGIALPMAIGNFLVMSYIATNHFLRPLTDDQDPLLSSMSLTSPRWVDFLHLHFSHHIEHHIFPKLNHRYLPLVRQALRTYAGERYLAPPHWKAILWLYKTPRLYKDANTLFDPYRKRAVDIAEVEKALRA